MNLGFLNFNFTKIPVICVTYPNYMLNTDIQYFKIYDIGNRQKLEFGLLAYFLGVSIQGRFTRLFK
jgi:hypothetical protein